ncbi:MAG: hypothetical protein HKK66_06830 [Chlorobiaceae bacterium]|nr:hypothetical protein [Chlorobiaceae bacterium]
MMIILNTMVSFNTSHRKLNTIILAASWGGYAQRKDFEGSLHRVVSKLLSMNREVVLVMDVPKMKYDLPHAMFMATLTNRDFKSIIPSPLQDLLPTRADYIQQNNDVLKVFIKLAENPKVTIVYPDSILFKKGRYMVFRDNELFYKDTGHLTTAGSRFIAPVFEPILHKR